MLFSHCTWISWDLHNKVVIEKSGHVSIVLLLVQHSQKSMLRLLLLYLFWSVLCMPYGLPPLLLQCVGLRERLHYVADQNLVYRFRNVHLIIVVNIKVPPTRHVQHAQQFSEASMEPLEYLEFSPLKWL